MCADEIAWPRSFLAERLVQISDAQKLCDVSKDGRRVKKVFELALSSEEDAPMTMALDRAVSGGTRPMGWGGRLEREALTSQ